MHLETDPIGVTERYGHEAIVDSQDVLPGTVDVDVDDGGTLTIVERFEMGRRGCGRRPMVRLCEVVAFVAETAVSLPPPRPEPRLLFD